MYLRGLATWKTVLYIRTERDARTVITEVLVRETGGIGAGGDGNRVSEAETQVMSLERGGGGHKPRNTGGHKQLKKATDFPLRASRRNQAC